MAQEFVIKASAATTATETSTHYTVPPGEGVKGVLIHLDITAASGVSPTLNIAVQRFDVASSKWLAIVGGAFAQQTTAAGQLDLVIYPGIAETPNRTVSDHIGTEWRVLSTIAGTTPSFTFSLAGQYLK